MRSVHDIGYLHIIDIAKDRVLSGIDIQLGRRLSQKQIYCRSVVDLRVKVNKFKNLGLVLSAICYDLLLILMPTLV